MVRLIPVLLFGFIFYFVYVQTLECGITEQIGEDEVQSVLRKCMEKKEGETEDKAVKTSDSSESSEKSVHHDVADTNKSMTSRPISKREVTTPESAHDEQTNNGTSNKCFLQCIFADLEMINSSGYPDHSRVIQGILKNAKGRELRDFLQDSTDECFQLMEHGEKLDTCDYATHLVTCLAEKGRSNCADWQIMNLPFHT